MRTYRIDMIPGKVGAVINASQYDYGYEVQVTLYEGSVTYQIPSGASIRVEGTKSDAKGFSYECRVANGIVYVPIQIQMTAVQGDVPCELVVYKNGLRVGSCNFILVVEESALDGDTDISETDIPAIIAEATEQMEAAASSASRAAASATRAASSAASAETAKDAAMDAAQDAIEAAQELQTAIQFNAALIHETASGTIASFSDGADNIPMQSVVAEITPIQNLNGQPNPYPAGGGKNKLHVGVSTTTVNGVTFTVNEDGTVKVNGTATANTYFYLIDGASGTKLNVPDGSYTLSGCPSGGSFSTYYLQANDGSWKYDYGSDAALTSSGQNIRSIGITVKSGTTMSNLVFKPMVRLSSVSDATFAPYSNICPISGRTGMTVTRAGRNLLKLPYAEDTKTQNGITFTVNADGSIRVAGTATGTATLILANTAALNELPFLGSDATVTLFGCPSGGSSSTYYMTANLAGDNTGDVGASNLLDTGAGDTKYYTNTHVKSAGNLFIRVMSGTTIDKVFYPMLTLADSVSEWESPKDNKIISVSWETEAGTVYGGTLDVVSGVLTVDRIFRECDANSDFGKGGATSFNEYFLRNSSEEQVGASGTLYGADNIICSHAASLSASSTTEVFTRLNGGQARIVLPLTAPQNTLALFKTWLGEQATAGTPLQFCYKLATPQTYQLTPTEVRTILGGNNIYTDAGDVSVEYVADTKMYIDGKIAELQALVLENN